MQDELTAYIERIDFYREKGDAELVSLTYKRLYYTATQHYYLNKYYSEEEDKMKRESVIKAILKDSWLKLKNDKYFGARTKLRFIWIHLFPMEFGRRSIKHKVDFTI